MGSAVDDEEFNALSERFGLKLRKVRVKRLFNGDDARPAKKAKANGLLSADVIALVHDRVHELNLVPGRHVFLTQRDWLRKDLNWLIERCDWLFALIRD